LRAIITAWEFNFRTRFLRLTGGHEADFWATFKWLLQEAVEASVYTPIDFKLHPRNFCGLEITYSPLDDMSLETIMGT
jgi:hypothetical protein